MSSLAESVTATLTPLVHQADPDVFLVDVKVLQGRRKALEILADTDAGIQIQQIARLNRTLRELTDGLTSPIAFDEYEFDVMSPGVGEPLRLPRQYHNNIGRTLRIVMEDGTTHEGRLTAADETVVTLSFERKNPTTKKKETVDLPLPLADIKKAVVQVSFK